jgi:hypothetical protein
MKNVSYDDDDDNDDITTVMKSNLSGFKSLPCDYVESKKKEKPVL